jgi:hypothetical protein
MKTLLTIGLILSALGMGSLAQAKNADTNCYIQSYDGHYLTAIGGGGHTHNAIHTDATQAKSWERFTLVDADKGTPNITYGIRTVKGFYLSAQDGGGRITNVIHTNRTRIDDWEEFQFESLGGGYYAIKTFNGRYLTAVNSGGLSTQVADVLHSDARQVKKWEKFKLTCGVR